ncbi:unnamed protein product [Rotaria sp. Silwood2]|nr:unnamed protein product [Rotaria sp. Silwood2]
MNKQNQYDKKHKFTQQKNDNNDDDAQIEKTLNFFDSILNEYLYDQDITDESKIEKSYSQTKSTNNIGIQETKQDFHFTLCILYLSTINANKSYSFFFKFLILI